MDELKHQVETILKDRFAGADVDLYEAPPGRVSGIVTAPDFSDIDNHERQSLLRDALRNRMGADAQLVSIMLTRSPEEYNMLREVEALVR